MGAGITNTVDDGVATVVLDRPDTLNSRSSMATDEASPRIA